MHRVHNRTSTDDSTTLFPVGNDELSNNPIRFRIKFPRNGYYEEEKEKSVSGRLFKISFESNVS